MQAPLLREVSHDADNAAALTLTTSLERDDDPVVNALWKQRVVSGLEVLPRPRSAASRRSRCETQSDCVSMHRCPDKCTAAGRGFRRTSSPSSRNLGDSGAAENVCQPLQSAKDSQTLVRGAADQLGRASGRLVRANAHDVWGIL